MPLVFPKRQSFESDISHSASKNVNLRLAGAESGLVDYNKDFFKLLLCACGMLLHACILIAVDIVDLSSRCTQFTLGTGLLAGISTLVGAIFCFTLHFSYQLRHSLRWIRLALILQVLDIILDVGNFIRFYSTVSFNLLHCSFEMKIVLGTPTIVSIFMGIPATFIAAVILWNLRSWLVNFSMPMPIKGP